MESPPTMAPEGSSLAAPRLTPPPAANTNPPPQLNPRPAPWLTATARDPHRQRRLDDVERPTPANYLDTNRFAPPCLKRSGPCARLCEHSGHCQWLGRVGPRLFDRYRIVVMTGAAFITFVLMLLLIVPLLDLSADAVFIESFHWAEGTTHWDLAAPAAWNEEFFLGLTGMAVTNRRSGRQGFTRYDSAACQAMLGDACDACAAAGGMVCATLAVSIAVAGLCVCMDLQRAFQWYDLNFVKVAALALHLGLGLTFTILPLALFTSRCFNELPGHTVDQSRGIGLEHVWGMSLDCHLLIALIALRPLPAILHLLTPTPSWASGKARSFRSFGRLHLRPGAAPEDGGSGDEGEDAPHMEDGPDAGQQQWTDICGNVDAAYLSHASPLPSRTSSMVGPRLSSLHSLASRLQRPIPAALDRPAGPEAATGESCL